MSRVWVLALAVTACSTPLQQSTSNGDPTDASASSIYVDLLLHACGTAGAPNACASDAGVLCTNFQTDPDHCGTCDTACDSDNFCVRGVCASTCTLSVCGALCTNLTTDANNCGACGTACALGQACAAGACVCPSATPDACGTGATAFCTNEKTDSHNCGACGVTCNNGQVCDNGACVIDCGTLTECGGDDGGTLPYCANLTTDNYNCGTCGNTCATGHACTNGACALTCGSLTECTSDGGIYCANLATDNHNCGTCGNICASGHVCTNGACALTCGSLSTCTGDGGLYCANLTTDNNNCGACGATCTGGTSCQNHTCTSTCGSSQHLCGGVCTTLTLDPNNCGACGNVCSLPNGTSGCVSGSCFIAQCNVNRANCNSNSTDGCEVDLTSDSHNCGACGNVCAAGDACFGGVCHLDCGAHTYCPNAGSPYCANTDTDGTNCGACGNHCTSGQVCGGGVCGNVCGAFTYCTPSVGAPYCSDLTTNTDCGACNNKCALGETCAAGVACTTANSAGLIGYWAFDDDATSHSAIDSTGHHLSGALGSGVTFVAGAGKQGSGAATFTGAGYIDVTFPNDAHGDGTGLFMPLGNITYSMWVKTTSTSAQGIQVVSGNTWTGGCDRVVGNGAGANELLTYNVWSENNFTGVNQINDGAWHQVTYVLDEAHGFFSYVDGVLDAQNTTPTTCGVGCSNFNWASEYLIGTGANCRYGAGNFVGAIDDVRLYDHPLTAVQVTALYNATK